MLTPPASNHRSIPDRAKIRNHTKPLYSKRQHDLPVKKTWQENVAQSAIRISQKTLPLKNKMKK